MTTPATMTPVRTDHERHVLAIRERSEPLQPLPSGVRAVRKRLPDIQAVLFDVYGTLFVSASGEIGTIDDEVFTQAFADALAHAGLELTAPPAAGAHELQATILATHDRLHATRVEYPEVDIVKVWRTTLAHLAERGFLAGAGARNVDDVDVPALALDFELRSNPVWPMPGAQRCLTELSARGLAVGVVSNGQWFSPLLFPALMGGCLATLGVAPDLQLWSHTTGEAKPGMTLFRQARAALDLRGIRPEQVLFVGNDMLVDMLPATAAGFRTALFAGDLRSLRMRNDDERVTGIVPDLVVLNLPDIVRCVRAAD